MLGPSSSLLAKWVKSVGKVGKERARGNAHTHGDLRRRPDLRNLVHRCLRSAFRFSGLLKD